MNDDEPVRRRFSPFQENGTVEQFAEREMASFVAAVTKAFGPEQARLSADDWIDELERTGSPDGFTERDWRNVTIAAAARLAIRVNGAFKNFALPGAPRTDTAESSREVESCQIFWKARSTATTL